MITVNVKKTQNGYLTNDTDGDAVGVYCHTSFSGLSNHLRKRFCEPGVDGASENGVERRAFAAGDRAVIDEVNSLRAENGRLGDELQKKTAQIITMETLIKIANGRAAGLASKLARKGNKKKSR